MQLRRWFLLLPVVGEHRAGLEKAAEDSQSCLKSGTGRRILGLWGNGAVKRKRQSRPAGRQDTSSHKNVKNQRLPQIKPPCLPAAEQLRQAHLSACCADYGAAYASPHGCRDRNLCSHATAKATKNALGCTERDPATQASGKIQNLSQKHLRQRHSAETEALCSLWWFYQGWAFGNFLTPIQSDSNTNTLLGRDSSCSSTANIQGCIVVLLPLISMGLCPQKSHMRGREQHQTQPLTHSISVASSHSKCL